MLLPIAGAKKILVLIVACPPLIIFFATRSHAEVHPLKASGKPNTGECAILLHGMARTHNSMNALQKALARAGYHTFSIDYPSTAKPIATLAAEYIPPARYLAEQQQCKTLHFVTHSLGGIVVRTYLKTHPLDNLGHVVMLSPPNQGSAVAREFKDDWYFQWLNGPAGQELAAGPASTPAQLGMVSYSVGIITGNSQAFFDGWLVPLFDEPNDGKVSISEARLEGMSDFLVVNESHPFIMDSRLVHQQVLHFLQHGTFSRAESNAP